MDGGIKAQLPSLTKNPQKYIEDDNWIINQKLDGHRVIVQIKDGKVTALNRNGEERNIPSKLSSSMSKIKSEWAFDGELIDSTYWIFDIIHTPMIDIAKKPWSYRNAVMENIFDSAKIEGCKLLSYKEETSDKQKFFDECFDKKVEGVVFKHKDKPYLYGRNENFLKYKFVKTVDCVIIDRGINGKDNFVLGVYRDGEIFECGKVSAITGEGKKASVGDVVEVTILYTTESGRLYQPVKPKLRKDKLPDECTFDQIQQYMTNTKVINE